jgi:hypothetical protein
VLKKSITYKDFNEKEVTDEFHFHLRSDVLLELEASLPGGLAKYSAAVIESNDGGRLLELFKRLITSSIGKVSDDGKRFVQNDDIRSSFMETNAYWALIMELAQDETAAATFFNALVPKDLASQVEEVTKAQSSEAQRVRESAESTPVERGHKVITRAELAQMDMPELTRKMQDGWTIQT